MSACQPHSTPPPAPVSRAQRQLEKQVESGSLKLVEEKRALQEISQWKRSRRIVEGFQVEQEGIDAERAKADELRKQLDDPVAKAASDRYDAIKKELDELAAKHSHRFHVYYVLNNPPPSWDGGVGFVSKEQIEKYLPPTDSNIKILLCGACMALLGSRLIARVC